ncbi:MAG: hypothetical protein WBB29_06120 [Geitlerinemataceae cyanobacterium]
MTDTNIHIARENDRERLPAAKLDRLLNWMQSAQTPNPPKRLSAEQLSELLVQISHPEDMATQTST